MLKPHGMTACLTTVFVCSHLIVESVSLCRPSCFALVPYEGIVSLDQVHKILSNKQSTLVLIIDACNYVYKLQYPSKSFRTVWHGINIKRCIDIMTNKKMIDEKYLRLFQYADICFDIDVAVHAYLRLMDCLPATIYNAHADSISEFLQRYYIPTLSFDISLINRPYRIISALSQICCNATWIEMLIENSNATDVINMQNFSCAINVLCKHHNITLSQRSMNKLNLYRNSHGTSISKQAS